MDLNPGSDLRTSQASFFTVFSFPLTNSFPPAFPQAQISSPRKSHPFQPTSSSGEQAATLHARVLEAARRSPPPLLTPLHFRSPLSTADSPLAKVTSTLLFTSSSSSGSSQHGHQRPHTSKNLPSSAVQVQPLLQAGCACSGFLRVLPTALFYS